MLEKHVDLTSIYRYGIRSLRSSLPFLSIFLFYFIFYHLAYIFLNSIGKENVDRALFYIHTRTHIHTHTRARVLSFSVSVCSSLFFALDRDPFGGHLEAEESRTWRSCGRGLCGREFRLPVTVTVLVALQNRVAPVARNRGLTVLQWIMVL